MLKLSDVDVFYGKVHALKSVSMHVEEGELVTLIGANGAGKSTTLKTISGMLRPQKGSIFFQGERIDGLTSEKIVNRRIAHCPEGRRVFPDMSVRENLEMGAYVRKNKTSIRSDLEMVFELFPILKERSQQDASCLSGGEQQMLAIGRALMLQPLLIMFDEPSLGLAPIMVEKVVEVIAELNRRGTTILLVEQNADMALRLSKRAYVLETGRIGIEGLSKDLLQNEHVQKAYLGG
ncbi:MAG: ABC transporter ATP-binding protein [Anaerolineae bacterium]|nr:ABC transporter ATP-binding protein [Anaerolineae bacterium]